MRASIFLLCEVFCGAATLASSSFHLAVLFEKLVEQHRVHRFVADGVRLALFVSRDQIRVHLLHLLSHEAKLRNPSGSSSCLVAESHRFERQDRFACLVHRLDRVLKPLRGDNSAEATISTYDDPYAISDGHSTNTRNNGAFLNATRADSNRIQVTSLSRIANIDVVIPPLIFCPAPNPTAILLLPEHGTRERFNPNRRIAVAICETGERRRAYGRVGNAGSVTRECHIANRGVKAAGGVKFESIITVGVVEVAGRVGMKRVNAGSNIKVAG